jgi:orotate phosphoribosyltransferase
LTWIKSRLFFSREQISRHAVCVNLAAALQSEAVTQRIRALCGVARGGAPLRIEYCLDMDEFWLEPHTDIGANSSRC